MKETISFNIRTSLNIYEEVAPVAERPGLDSLIEIKTLVTTIVPLIHAPEALDTPRNRC